MARVEAAAQTLTPEDWQFRAQGRRRGTWRTTAAGEDVTRLVDDACVFLNRPGFEGGPGCALHRAALRRGERPLDLKPTVCWQLPLRREDDLDADGHVTSRVIEWDRKHWGGGGDEFHWWCTDAADAFVGHQPVYLEMRDELVEMVGEPVFAMLVPYLETKAAGATVTLPHPAVRAR